MKETADSVFFWGSIFSQWSKCSFTDGTYTYNTAEKYMMMQKALLFGDMEIAAKIMAEPDPDEQKKLGRKVKGFTDPIWDENKLQIVTQGSYLKFSQNEQLKKQLLATGNKTLVEASPKDHIWGVKLHWSDPLILDPKNWKGQNLLGIALMEARKMIREENEKKK